MVKYVIRPSKLQKLLDENSLRTDNSTERSRRKSIILKNKPMYFSRWARWFDLDTLNDVLMEEGYEEVVVEDEKHFEEEVSDEDIEKAMKFDMKDLGI